MKKKRIVLAFGGNALQTKGEATAEAQKAVAAKVGSLVSRLSDKYEIVISHGNGPQVGNILVHEEQGSTKSAPAMPLETAVAMSQGQIGYWLAQAIENAFIRKGKKRKVATIIAQSVVDRNDKAFRSPTKPVGSFYTESEALKIMKMKGWVMREDAGRGWRRVVPSPKPQDIIEKREIKTLVDSGVVVITVGGGGIPVYRTKVLGRIKGIDAVIDKDFAAAKLASLIHADKFVAVTAVPSAYLNFGTKEQKKIHHITAREMRKYIEEEHFKEGSMLPKVEAALSFAKNGREGIICGIDNLERALKGESGTIIV